MPDDKTDPREANEDQARPADSPKADTQNAAVDAGAQLGDDLNALLLENADMRDRLLRTMADMENLRRRTEREKTDTARYAISNFARDVLTVGDNLKRTIQHVPAEAAAQEFGIPIACSIPIPPCLIDPSSFPHINFGYCAAGTEGAYYTIDPLGNVRPCNHSPMILGNLFENTFESIIAGQQNALFSSALPASCRHCAQRDACRGSCKAAAQACYGSLTVPEPFLGSGLGRDEPLQARS